MSRIQNFSGGLFPPLGALENMNIFLNTDEFEEIINSIELLNNQAKELIDIYQWKWVILSMHSTLQGFMVVGLTDSTGLNILRDNISQKWLRAYRNNEPYPVEKLDTFLNLFKKIKSEKMLRSTHSKKFESTTEIDRCVKKVNILKNKFIHLIPGGWLLEVSGLPNICVHCLEIIECMGWESNNVFWLNEELEERCKIALEECKNTFNELNEEYRNSQGT